MQLVLRGTRRVAITLLGVALLCAGLAGLVLPILPGWLLVFVAFAILAREYTWARRALEGARRIARRRQLALRRHP